MKDKMKSKAHRTMDRMKDAMSGKHDDIMAVQQALKDKGHDPGTIDGVMGPKTREALRDFQQKEGLQATGRLDAGTRDKLGVQARTSATDTSSPSASPATGGSSPGATSGSSSTSSGTGGGTASGPMSTPPLSEKDAARDASKTPAGTTKQPATR
jgi:peptidoglycan hydrolase-like protein with peptidoglycan-binding domain